MKVQQNSPRRPRTIVTGAAVRVGRATASEFARRGHDVVLAVRKIDAIAQASCEIVRKSAHDAGHPDAKIELRAANLDDPIAVVALAATFASEPLDVIVHCASRYDARAIGEIDAEYALALSHQRTCAALVDSGAAGATFAEHLACRWVCCLFH